jgi:hypothetical protein
LKGAKSLDNQKLETKKVLKESRPVSRSPFDVNPFDVNLLAERGQFSPKNPTWLFKASPYMTF